MALSDDGGEPEVELALAYRLGAHALLVGLCAGTRLPGNCREIEFSEAQKDTTEA